MYRIRDALRDELVRHVEDVQDAMSACPQCGQDDILHVKLACILELLRTGTPQTLPA